MINTKDWAKQFIKAVKDMQYFGLDYNDDVKVEEILEPLVKKFEKQVREDERESMEQSYEKAGLFG